MSFRIDDILKKDVRQSPVKEHIHSNLQRKSQNPIPYDNSILQQTLLSKNSSYYKTHSEPCYRICSNWAQYNVYAEKTNDIVYHNMYVKNNLWSNAFSTFPMLLLPPNLNYSKRKGGQVRFTSQQTDALEKSFMSHKYLSPEDRRVLANSLKLSDRQVKTWFQNRRAKWRRCSASSSPNFEIPYIKQDKLNSDKKNILKTVQITKEVVKAEQE